MIATLVFIIFTLILCIGMPIAFTLIISGFLGLYWLRGIDVAFKAMVSMPFATASEGGLAAIPLFILMGFLATRAGVSDKAYGVAAKLVGHVRGGLGIATVFACAGFAATSGSSVATSAAVGGVAMAEMKKFGYDDRISAGTVASAGLLGIMIPPSIMLVIFGIITETHIGKLLIGGIIPGILTAIVFSLGIYFLAVLKPHLMPTTGMKLPLRERLISLKDTRGICLLILIIVGGIYSGLFTSSEAAAVGATVTLMMALIKLGPSKRSIILDDFSETARISGMIFLTLIGASLFSQFLALSGVATDFSRYLVNLELNRYLILVLILLFYIPLGTFLDPIPMCLITLPIIFPAIKQLGFDPVWFGILIVKMCELANISPPVGFNCQVITGINPDISLDDVYRGAAYFCFLEIVVLVILVLVPSLTTFLPNLMFL